MTALEPPAPELPIHAFLRDRMRDGFGNVLSRFAEACATTPSLAAKWVSSQPDRRRTPNTASCQKIADGLGVPLDYVLALAGHRPPPSEVPTEAPALAALIAVLRRRWNELQEPEQRAIAATIRAVAQDDGGFSCWSVREYLTQIFAEQLLKAAPTAAA